MTRISRTILLLLALVALVLVPATAWAQTSTIDTDVGDIDNALACSQLTKSFYASGLHWFFWVDTDDDYARYSTSADLEPGSWAASINLIDTDAGQKLAVWYDEGTDTVHVVAGDKSEADTYYRMGTPESDGAITWADAWDYVCESWTYVGIVTDSNGYPVISSGNDVYRSTTKDGTFTSDGAPYNFTGDTGSGCPVLVPLTSGKVSAITSDSGSGDMFLSRWDGFNWSAEKELNDTYWLRPPRAINVDDDVYLVIKRNTAGAVWRTAMVKYTYSTNSFGTVFWVYNYDTGGGNNPAVTKDTNDDIYILWPNYYYPEGGGQTDKIYYRIYDVSEDDGANSLSDKVTFVDESVLDGLPAACTDIHCDYDSDGFLKVYYPADAARAKVKGESLLSVTTLSAAAITETTARLRGEITLLGMASASTVGFEYQICDSGSSTTISESGAFGLGVFNYDIEGLDSDEAYEYRAFATDASGTAYGEWVSFLTAYDYTSPWAPGGNDTLIPVPTAPPGWHNPSPSTGAIEGTLLGGLLNPFFESSGFPVEFIWWVIFAILCNVVCILTFAFGKHTFVVFVSGTLVIGSMCSLGIIDWWLIFVYIAFGLSLLINEKQIAF